MVELSICIGSACHLKGAYNVIYTFQQFIEENRLHDRIDFKSCFCIKECQNPGVSISLNGQKLSIRPETAREFFRTEVLPLTKYLD
ncbi:MAG: (2Fe-2S) ferredoxin domain-containing protein [Oscillospiraceae bacterium]